jgi:hypothetical protein
VTTVYIPTYVYNYEGETHLGVFSTREKALAALAKERVEGNDVCGDNFWIETWEVDGECTVEEIFPNQLREAAEALK